MADMMALLKAEAAAMQETFSEVPLKQGGVLKLTSLPLRPIDMQKVGKRHPGFLQNITLEGMISLLIDKARLTETGEPAFTEEHRPMLMRQTNDFVSKAFGDLFGEQLEELRGDEDDKDVRKGKSKAIS